MDNNLIRILQFLNETGIDYTLEAIDGKTFLPGLKLRAGTLVIDIARLLYPGDILHEAGHLATMPPEIRITMSDDLENNDLHQGGEMMAIAWSYAACIYLQIDPKIVFHEHGYKGGGDAIVENFSKGNYFGVPLLVWSGMTENPGLDKPDPIHCFPKMKSWICRQRPG